MKLKGLTLNFNGKTPKVHQQQISPLTQSAHVEGALHLLIKQPIVLQVGYGILVMDQLQVNKTLYILIFHLEIILFSLQQQIRMEIILC